MFWGSQHFEYKVIKNHWMRLLYDMKKSAELGGCCQLRLKHAPWSAQLFISFSASWLLQFNYMCRQYSDAIFSIIIYSMYSSTPVLTCPIFKIIWSGGIKCGYKQLAVCNCIQLYVTRITSIKCHNHLKALIVIKYQQITNLISFSYLFSLFSACYHST